MCVRTNQSNENSEFDVVCFCYNVFRDMKASVGAAVNSIYFHDTTVLVLFYLVSKCLTLVHIFLIQSKLFVPS